MRSTISVVLAVAVLLFAKVASPQGAIPGRRVFTSDTENVGFPTLSPDGKWLVYMKFISNQETQLMIRALAGGEARTLVADEKAGTPTWPQFTARGDRLVLVSGLPRRGPGDNGRYLVSAPFDTRTGTLTGPPRQVTLEHVGPNARLAPALSPDGEWVAYISVADGGALRVVPITGGNARTLTTDRAGWLGWTADSRFVTYQVRESDKSVRLRVSREGGPPTRVATFDAVMGPVSPDGRYFITGIQTTGGASGSRMLRLFANDGSLLAEVPVPRLNPASVRFSPDGRYLLWASDNSTAPIKLVPAGGGPIRQLTQGETYEWMEGWGADAQTVFVAMNAPGDVVPSTAVVGLDGQVKSRIRLPAGAILTGIQDGHAIYKVGNVLQTIGWRLMARRLDDGSERELARDVIGRECCDPIGAGGMYWGISGKEFYYRQVKGDRLHVMAMSMSGGARLLADLPRNLAGLRGYGVFGNRVVYTDAVGDSVRLRMISGPGRPATTLSTFHRSSRPNEHYWSHDGRALSLYTGSTPEVFHVFRFDEAGALQGAPQTFTLPFEYIYETFWLPDKSGLTMIAQPRGAANTEVALVRLADPQHPVLLTKGDPANKWGHALSPDGKYVAYPSEQLKGSAIYLIEVAELLRLAPARK